MKKLLPLFFFALIIMLSTSSQAQNIDFDKRLLSKFSKKELKSMPAETLNYWIFYLENSYEIVDLPKEKPDAVPTVIKLSSTDKKNVNVFELGFTTHAFARDYVRIEGTDKMIIILPQTEIDERYNAVKK